MKGTLFGVGVGPGDPELMTLAAVRAIERCPVVAVPDPGGREQLALQTAAAHVAGKEILHLHMPMTRDPALLEASHAEAARAVCEHLDAGRDVAFLTIGDPAVYSTCHYLLERVRGAGHSTRSIPGVTSFCAAAAALDIELCAGEEALHIFPGGRAGEFLGLAGTRVIMKTGGGGETLAGLLRERGLLDKAALAERCGLAGERTLASLDGWDGRGGYFTTIVVKE